MSRSIVRAALLAALFVSAPSPLLATTIDLSWSVCSPVQSTYLPTDEPSAFWLLVSAVGQFEPHQGYQVRLVAGDAADELPDAWRFDAGGCQGPDRIQLAHLAPAVVVKACPSFSGARFATTTKWFQPAPPELGVPGTMGDLLVRSSYAIANTQIDPAQRYTVAAFAFDHYDSSVEGPGTPGVTCGGFERAVCFSLLADHSWWEGAGGTRVPFAIGQGSAVFRGECKPVPVLPATWGAIKSTYRR